MNCHGVHKVRHRGFAFELLESLKPKFLGRRVPHSKFRLLSRILRILPKARKRMTRGAPVPYTGMDGILFFNEESVALGETRQQIPRAAHVPWQRLRQ